MNLLLPPSQLLFLFYSKFSELKSNITFSESYIVIPSMYNYQIIGYRIKCTEICKVTQLKLFLQKDKCTQLFYISSKSATLSHMQEAKESRGKTLK